LPVRINFSFDYGLDRQINENQVKQFQTLFFEKRPYQPNLTVLPIGKKNSVAQFQFIRTGILQIDKTAAVVAIFYKYQLLVDALDPACTHTH
jgi:hypothetical protein